MEGEVSVLGVGEVVMLLLVILLLWVKREVDALLLLVGFLWKLGLQVSVRMLSEGMLTGSCCWYWGY